MGPLRALSFRPPTPAAEKLFMDDFVKTLADYRAALATVRAGKLPDLPDKNFDTGEPARYGQYRLADEACDHLLIRLEAKKFSTLDAPLKTSLLAFYGKAVPADPKAAAALEQLRTLPQVAID